MNPVQQLLAYLDQYGPGNYVVITEELAKIFPPPAKYNYGKYATEIKLWLAELEQEQLIKLNFTDKALFDATFGDLNNVYCSLEYHEIRAKITRDGHAFLAPNSTLAAVISLGQNAQFINNSPGAIAIVSTAPGDISIDSRSGNTQEKATKRTNKMLEFLKTFSESTTSLQKTIFSLTAILAGLGIHLLSSDGKKPAAAEKTKITAVDTVQMKISPAYKADTPALPSPMENLRYPSLSNFSNFSKTDVIFIVWKTGHSVDSNVAEKLYADLKASGYHPQPAQRLVFLVKTNFEGRPYSIESHQLSDNTSRHLITINPDFDFRR